jgi:Zn-finger nucleic acid-binding protein
MEEVSYTGTRVDRCTGCQGLWFQAGELSRLRQDDWMADFILDEGSARIGKEFNRIHAINCPECGVRMLEEVDQEQKHIVYESCPDGHGHFLDAGEFTDLVHKTFWDRFKRKH